MVKAAATVAGARAVAARAATASSAAVTVAAARAACWVERETIGATKAAGVAAARQEVDTTEEGAGMVATEVTVVEEATAGVMVAMVVEAMVGVARAEEVAVVVTAAATGERGGAKVAMGERAGRVVKAEMRVAASRGVEREALWGLVAATQAAGWVAERAAAMGAGWGPARKEAAEPAVARAAEVMGPWRRRWCR